MTAFKSATSRAGISTLKFRTYEAGREALQGATLDFVQCDEEPAFDIYTELYGAGECDRRLYKLWVQRRCWT